MICVVYLDYFESRYTVMNIIQSNHSLITHHSITYMDLIAPCRDCMSDRSIDVQLLIVVRVSSTYLSIITTGASVVSLSRSSGEDHDRFCCLLFKLSLSTSDRSSLSIVALGVP